MNEFNQFNWARYRFSVRAWRKLTGLGRGRVAVLAEKYTPVELLSAFPVASKERTSALLMITGIGLVTLDIIEKALEGVDLESFG